MNVIEEADETIYYDADRALGVDPERGIEVVSCSEVDETNRPRGKLLGVRRAIRNMVMRATLGKFADVDAGGAESAQGHGQGADASQRGGGGGAGDAQFTEAGVSTFGCTDVDDASLLDGRAGFDGAPHKASGIPKGLVAEDNYDVQNTSYV